jgi:membrane protein DedA with SNARE-associated domain
LPRSVDPRTLPGALEGKGLVVLSSLSLSAAVHGYLALVLGIWAASVGVPVPEEVPLVSAGLLAAVGVIDLHWAIVLGMCACASGDLLVYAVGRRVGDHLTGHPWLARRLNGGRLQRARALYDRRGPWSLLVARLVPGLKMPSLFTAGALQMPLRRFVAYDFASVALLVPALVLLGYHSSISLARLHRIVRDVGLAAPVVVGGLVVLAAAFVWVRRRRVAVRVGSKARPAKPAA